MKLTNARIQSLPENDLESASASQPEWAASLLRKVELMFLTWKHAKLQKDHPEDSWWVAQGAEVTGPHCIADILAGLADGASPINVLPASLSGQEAPPWTTLHYQPLWHHSPAPKFYLKTLRTGGVFILAVTLACALWQVGHSPLPTLWIGQARSAWEKLNQRTTSVPTEAPPPVAVIAAAPVAIPQAAASSRNLPVSAPAPGAALAVQPLEPLQPAEEAIDFAALAKTPAQWPKEVILKTKVIFPIVINGKTAGSLQMPKGTVAKLLEVQGQRVTLQCHGSTQSVAIASTDLAERVGASRKTFSQAPEEALAVVPKAAPDLSARIVKTTTTAKVEIPGLEVQTPNYFGSAKPIGSNP